jgi:hypothetical protein
MNTEYLFEVIDEILPDKKIVYDFLNAISQLENQNSDSQVICIEVDDEEKYIPIDVDVKIITKAVFKEYTDIGFGTYRVMIAVGGIDRQEYGIIFPKHFFATLYYGSDCNFITSDFHNEMR